jgi:hypothetical protein
MKKTLLLLVMLTSAIGSQAQTNPVITSWLQNTTVTGTYYVAGNSTAITNNILVNCQQVEYSNDFVYVTTTGVPSYTTGPFQDGNPSQATNQSAIFKIPLSPTPNTGTLVATNAGNIGIFINGVALFDWRDGVAWNPTTNALCGGPGNPPCPGGPTANMDWNRDAIPAENSGFDCAKGHPAMGNYHHHQNPTAFDLDATPTSDVCNLYDADGLYVLDATAHAPLIGFAYDGFPIYGAYGYTNIDGTGGIARMKSGYELRNITTRTNGPAVDATYFLGYFREDYEYVANAAADYLDEHNGRFCITPDYPNGTYAYFATIDADLNSAYPYVVGPTFYGVSSDRKVSAISETTTPYTTTNTSSTLFETMKVGIYPNPATDLITVQFGGLVESDFRLDLIDATGRIIESKSINKGQTIAYFDVQTVYNGLYFVKISNGNQSITRKVIIARD